MVGKEAGGEPNPPLPDNVKKDKRDWSCTGMSVAIVIFLCILISNIVTGENTWIDPLILVLLMLVTSVNEGVRRVRR